MRFNFLVYTLISLSVTVCSRKNIDKHQTYFIDKKGTTLELTNTEWYLTKNSMGGGKVNLKVEGCTNGNRATIRTLGDGMALDYDLPLNPDKEFCKDIAISFTARFLPKGKFTANTVITVFRDDDTLKVLIESRELQY